MVTMMTVVTIRDVDDGTYDEFSAEARRQGRSIGELTTEAMQSYLKGLRPSESEYRISGLKELRISRIELEESGVQVELSDIENLILEDDIDIHTFEKFIIRISDCREVNLPSQLPKLRALAKCYDCEDVHFRKHDV